MIALSIVIAAIILAEALEHPKRAKLRARAAKLQQAQQDFLKGIHLK